MLPRLYCAIVLSFAVSPVFGAELDWSDVKLAPSRGKQGQSFTFTLSSATCQAHKNDEKLKVTSEELKKASVQPVGPDIEIVLQDGTDNCLRQGSLKIHDDAQPGDTQLLIFPGGDTKQPPITFALSVLDKMVGPLPPGLKPSVDVEWDVLENRVARDNFGKRVADTFYAIQVVIGNDSGYALQLASIGFVPRAVSTLGLIQKTLPNSSYVVTRGVLEEGQVISARNQVDRYLQGAAILLAGFTPFFKNVNHQATYGAAVAVFANPLIQSFEKVLPDKTINELKRLDDFSLRDGIVIANNTHVRTVVFFQRELLQHMVTLDKQQLMRGPDQGPGNIAEVIGALEGLQNSTPPQITPLVSRALNTAKEIQQHGAPRDSSKGRADLQAWATLQSQLQSILQSTPPTVAYQNQLLTLQFAVLRAAHTSGRGKEDVDTLLEPLLVRWELNRLVLVGDEIAYINRVRVDSNAPSVGAPLPMVVDTAASPSEGVRQGIDQVVTIRGEHLENASVTTSDTSGAIKLGKTATDPNGKFLNIPVTIDVSYPALSFDLQISGPGNSGSTTVRVGIDQVMVRAAVPQTIPTSGGRVTLNGRKLGGVKTFVNDSSVELTTENANDNSLTVIVPKQTEEKITLKFKTQDGKPVGKQQSITLDPKPAVKSITPGTLDLYRLSFPSSNGQSAAIRESRETGLEPATSSLGNYALGNYAAFVNTRLMRLRC